MAMMGAAQQQVLSLGREVQRMKGFINNLEFKMVCIPPLKKKEGKGKKGIQSRETSTSNPHVRSPSLAFSAWSPNGSSMGRPWCACLCAPTF